MALPSTVEDFDEYDDLNAAFETNDEREEREKAEREASEAGRPKPPWETEAESPADKYIREGFEISEAEGLRRGQAVQDWQNATEREDAPAPKPVTEAEQVAARQRLIDNLDPESDVTLTPFEQYAAAKLAEGIRASVYDEDAPALAYEERYKIAKAEAAQRGSDAHVVEPKFLAALEQAGSYDEAMKILQGAGQLAEEGSQGQDSAITDAHRVPAPAADDQD